MADQAKALVLSLITEVSPPKLTWKKEETNSHKLSSDFYNFHLNTLACSLTKSSRLVQEYMLTTASLDRQR